MHYVSRLHCITPNALIYLVQKGGMHMPPKKKPESEHYIKLNLTLRPELVQAMDRFGMSMGGRPRSRIITDALEEYLTNHKDDAPQWIYVGDRNKDK